MAESFIEQCAELISRAATSLIEALYDTYLETLNGVPVNGARISRSCRASKVRIAADAAQHDHTSSPAATGCAHAAARQHDVTRSTSAQARD
jgi:hypothetical protein